MPRSVYYQDSGNSLQFDRLPATRPTITLPHVDVSRTTSAALVFLLAGLMLLILCVQLLLTHQIPATGLLAAGLMR